MILTAYMDESGTHGGSPVTMMAGFLGNRRQWVLYEKKYKRLQRKFGFTIFRAKWFKDSDGEFSDWSTNKKHKLVVSLANMANKTLQYGFSAVLNNDEYRSIYRRDNRPKKLQIDTAYGVCFRGCLSFMVNRILEEYGPDPEARLPTINVVLEAGHKNAGDAVRLFNWIKKELADVRPELFGTLTFDTKEGCSPLHAADFLAHTTFITESNNLRPVHERRIYAPLPAEANRVWRVELGGEGLEGLRKQLLDRDAARLAYGRRPIADQVALASGGAEK